MSRSSRQLEEWLRTPRGTLSLLGGSLLLAAATALAVASQRAWFEGYVKETYPPLSARIEALGSELTGAEGVPRVRELHAAEKSELYAGWMQAGQRWPAAAPAAMMAGDPAFYLDRVFETLIAGSREQRLQAVRFLGRSREPRALDLLEEARARAARRGEDDLAREIARAMDSLRIPERFKKEGA